MDLIQKGENYSINTKFGYSDIYKNYLKIKFDYKNQIETDIFTIDNNMKSGINFG